MRKTRVVHKNYSDYDVFIGRPGFWGNPFKIGPDGTRAQVIEHFREWLLSGTPAANERLARLRELKGKALGCYCKPLACHGDVLAFLADERG